MKILNISDSPLKTKRFRVYLDNNKHYDFGFKTGQTYKDKTKRRNYQLKHYNSKREHHFISELIPSPALFPLLVLYFMGRVDVHQKEYSKAQQTTQTTNDSLRNAR